MSDIVNGFQNQIWLIIKYDGTKEIQQERIPLSDATELDIITKLGKLTGQMPQKDSSEGKRTAIMAGDNPYYVASLWRDDELKQRDERDTDRA